MKKDNTPLSNKKKETLQDKADQLVGRAEMFIDETAEKIHKSESYRKADQSLEKATRHIFRNAGKWWGKLGK